MDTGREQAAEQGGGEDGEPRRPGEFPFTHLIESMGDRREFVVCDHEAESDHPKSDGGEEVGAGSAPAEACCFLKVVTHGLAIPRRGQKCEPFRIERGA